MAGAAATIQGLLGRGGGWLIFLVGAGTVLAFAPWGATPLALLSPALLFVAWQGQSPRRAAQLGFAWGAGLFLAGTWWVYTAIHDFGQAPAWLAALLLGALVAIMAAYYAALGWLAARWAPDAGSRRWLLGLPAGWTLMEWLRGWLFTGFPWLQLGYSQSDTPLAGLAATGGVHLVTWAVALTAGAAVALLCGQTRQRLVALATVLAVWGAALAAGRFEWTEPAGEPVGVALLQGAIPQDLKWQADNRDATLALYRDLSRQALGVPLVVWPEAALPVLAHEVPEYLESLQAEANSSGTDLMIGLLRYDFEQQHYYNGLLALTADGSSWYTKRRLVPFGEYFPVPATVRHWLRLMSLPYVDMSPGNEGQSPLAAAGQRIIATICYEDAYGADQLAALSQATLLVNVTNNAWFGDSAAPHQQLQMARFRALESGRYLVRATSNGITAVIDSGGAVIAAAPQFVPAVLRAEVQPRQGLTPYARGGNWPVLLGCLLLVAAALGWPSRARPAG